MKSIGRSEIRGNVVSREENIKKRRPIHSYPKTREEEEELEVFSQLSLKFPSKFNEESSDEEQPIENECKHSETVCRNGVQICQDCGEHVYEEMMQEQEWRFYGDSDNKNSSDPSRCQYRKQADKGIRKDLEKLNLPSEVIGIADSYYFQVTKGEIKRSNLRKGIMFACVFEAFKDLKKHHTPEDLQALFEIDRKSMSKGLTYFSLRSNRKHKEYITAEHFIPKIIRLCELQDECSEPIIKIYQKVKDKSSLLSRSNPQSVSCGVVFYYLKKLNHEISSSIFGKTIGLSEITVNRIANEIEEIIESTFPNEN
jgi:transcription initiation factor TFIIIB Brf1 subunit/transcription initiation factor TFIIB